jgi:PilZ domain
MQERRKEQRSRVFWEGKVSFNRRQSVLDCVIRNMTETGAKLAVTESAFVPREFELVVPKRQAAYRARIIWRQSDQVGIQFETEKANPSPDLVRRPRRDLPPQDACYRASVALTPMGLIRQLKKLRQQSASSRRRLLLQGASG